MVKKDMGTVIIMHTPISTNTQRIPERRLVKLGKYQSHLNTRNNIRSKAKLFMYHRQISEVVEKSYQRFERTELKDGTEAMIIAIQEKVLSAKFIEAGNLPDKSHTI